MKRVSVDQLLKDKQLWNEFSVSLQNGGVAVIPTDTLYGFAVAADCEKLWPVSTRSRIAAAESR